MSSPRQDLNLRQMVYKTITLPLSYKGGWVSSARHPQKTLSAKNTKPYSSCFSGNFQIGWEFPPEVCLAFLFWKNRIFPVLPRFIYYPIFGSLSRWVLFTLTTLCLLIRNIRFYIFFKLHNQTFTSSIIIQFITNIRKSFR